METLTVILYDISTKKVEFDKIFQVARAYEVFNETTEAYEKEGMMMINEINIGKNTIVREFASQERGRLFDLILCGGRAETIKLLD